MSRNFLNEDFGDEEDDDDDFNPGAAQTSDHEDGPVKVCVDHRWTDTISTSRGVGMER